MVVISTSSTAARHTDADAIANVDTDVSRRAIRQSRSADRIADTFEAVEARLAGCTIVATIRYASPINADITVMAVSIDLAVATASANRHADVAYSRNRYTSESLRATFRRARLVAMTFVAKSTQDAVTGFIADLREADAVDADVARLARLINFVALDATVTDRHADSNVRLNLYTLKARRAGARECRIAHLVAESIMAVCIRETTLGIGISTAIRARLRNTNSIDALISIGAGLSVIASTTRQNAARNASEVAIDLDALIAGRACTRIS